MTIEGTVSTELMSDKGYSSEELYRILFEQATDGIFIADATWCFIEVNPRGCEMLGYTREEILNCSIQDLVPSEDLPQNPLKLKELCKEKKIKNERRLRCKDGTYIQVEIHGNILSDGTIFGMVRDISERKQAEKSIREAEEKFHSIFEHSLDGIFQSTPSGRFIMVNPALARMWGYESPQDLIGSITNIALQVYVDPEERDEFLRVMAEDEQVHGFEFRVYRKDGSIIWVQESVRAVKDTLGELSYYEGTARDITAQKQAEEFLRRSEERYRRTLNNMLEGCQIIDFDWRYIYVNDAVALQGRRKPEEMLMRSMLELYPGIEKTDLFADLQHCMDERIPHRMENHFTYPDGDTGWFELSIEPVPEGLFILSVDITERKKAEAALRQSEIFLREAQRVGRLGSWDWDAEQDITTWSEEYYRIYGYDPAQQSPGYQKHLEAYTPESAARLDAAVKKALQTGESYELDLEQARAEGTNKWITARGEVKRDLNGRITGLRGTAQDITEHKKVERELREREMRYRTLFENLPIPVFTKDLEGCYTSFNHEEARYWAESPIGRTDHDLLPSEIADVLRADDLQVMKTGEAWFGEEKFQSPHGLLYCLVRKVPLYDGEEKMVGVLGAGLDITDRKLAEKKLREAEQFAQSTIDALTAHICVLDKDGVILSVNRAWRDFAEANPPVPNDYFLGSNYLAICDAASGKDSTEASSFAAGLRAVIQKEREQFSMEYSCSVPGGERRWFVAQVTCFQIEEATRIVIAHENITKRRLMEEELRDSEARFSTVFHSSPQSIAITRMSDNRLIDVNQAWSEVTGIPREQAIGHTAVELGAWFDPEHRIKLIEQLQRQGRVQGFEIKLQQASGNVAEILMSAELIELAGEGHMLSMALDISDRKRAEKKIKQQLDRLIALNEIDRVIASSFDLNLTLRQLLKQVSRQLEVDAANILLVNPVTNTLDYFAGDMLPGILIKKQKLRLGEGYAGKVALERSMIIIPDLAKAESSSLNLAIDENFVAYYGLPLIAKGQLKGVLEVFQHKPYNLLDEEWLAFLETLAEQAAIAIDNTQMFNNLQQINFELVMAYDATIEGWSYALDLRDKETEGHTQRVANLTTELCKKFGLSDKEIMNARWGALLHDIGKMGIPDAILQKPEKLTESEWEIMKMHPVFARNMLDRVNYLKSAIDIPYCHHEHWDGSGYPHGLKNEQIPIAARIFAVVDAWDALTSDRPYRPAWPKNEALDYIKSAAGTQFDPQVVKVFVDSKELWDSKEQ